MEFKELVYSTLGKTEDRLPPSGDEPERTEALFDTLAASLEERGANMTPLLALRTADLVSAWMTVAKLEGTLRTEGIVSPGQKPVSETDDPRGPKTDSPRPANRQPDPHKRPAPNPLLDSAAKAWERLRKAMKDLEEMFPEKPPMQALTLPDLVAPLFEKAEGVVEDATAFEERKKRRKARRNGIKKPDEPTAAAES